MTTETFYGNVVLKRITDSRLFTSSWQTLYDLINNNVSDPDARGSKWIYGSYPDAADTVDTYYPLIVIDKTAFQNTSTETIDRNIYKYGMNCNIDVLSTSAAQLDSISDSIVEVLLKNQTSLPWNFSFGTSNDEFYTRSGKRIHDRTITVTFEYVLDVS